MTGAELIDLRKKLNLTVNDLCLALGVSRSTYNNWARYERAMSATSRTAFEMLDFLHYYGLLDEWLSAQKQKTQKISFKPE